MSSIDTNLQANPRQIDIDIPNQNLIEKEVVYIGPAMLIPGGNSGPKVKSNTHYTCFEIEGKCLEQATREYKKISENIKKYVDLVIRSGTDTRLLDNSVDEVHMHNVIADPDTEYKKSFFVEAHRILKPKGSFYIAETNTPTPFENVVVMSRDNGFSMSILSPDPQLHVSKEEVKLFNKLYNENKDKASYNKNFMEWYGLLKKMKVVGNAYSFSESEKDIIIKYRGSEKPLWPLSYLVKLTKE